MPIEQAPIVIIGSGPAGLTAAIYAARANLQPVVIEGNKPGGQLMGTSFVENWPGITSILGPDLMHTMREHARTFGTQFIEGDATKISIEQPFIIHIGQSKKIKASAIILALGASPKRLGCPGENEYWGKGITTCAICDGALYKDRKVLIVGGGDSAMEDASFLSKFTKDITIVHILDKLTACQAMQQRVLNNPSIKIIYKSTVTEIKGDGKKVNQAIIKEQNTGKTQTIDVDGIFVAIGLNPNTQLVKDIVKLDKWGYIELVKGMQTSVPGIFAAGDAHDYTYRQAITAAGSGCMAALDAQWYIHSL
ncbi:MAG TPA: thioredoxin-disulfide reductase [Candidatus Babeliales bacterium]|jgi:thioredoxin reductase (NADPH)|nr:thioredoxin-disulfide reductase [Candidatus Babeliales bacterium]